MRAGRATRLLALPASGMALLLGVACATSGGLRSFGGRPNAESHRRIEADPHRRDGAFQNDEPTVMVLPGSTLSATLDSVFPKEMASPICPLPLVDPTAQLATPPATGLRITWFGHSSTLIELDGRRVLTDPQWSERASPFSIAGPKRFHPPAMPLEALPPLDAVLISHDHYDHLDMETVKALAVRGVPFHVGLGIGAHLEAFGVPRTQIVEHAWGEATPLSGGVRLVSVPARHFSGRRLVDADQAQWTSWVIAGPSHRVFFSGDTGLTDSHARTAEAFGPFDVDLLEIGQADARWPDVHLGPEGALQAHRALGGKLLLPIHWSTFSLAPHAWSRPAETLFTAGEAQGIALATPKLGEPFEPGGLVPHTPWWRAYPPMVPACP